jgi:bifunctional non-homologous end joining protein LigD
MLATSGELPLPRDHDGWAYEMKWDGVRAVVYVADGAVRVLTRNDREVSATYPETHELAASLGGHSAILDGELVAFDADGRPDFGELQRRMHVANPALVRALVAEVPVHYLAFDLLGLDGQSLLGLAYDERRELLESLDLQSAHVSVPPVFVGDGRAALAASRAAQLEGVVAKLRSSTYHPGRRSADWVKVKNIRMQEVVVGGWRPGKGHRSGGVGSLLVGIPTDQGLVYAGHVGTGFSDAMLADLGSQLASTVRATSPFSEPLPPADARDAVFVSPSLVGEVAFAEWTRDGRLRHPVWRGVRDDKAPADVVRET